MPRHSVPLGEDKSSQYARYITPQINDSQPDRVRELHEAVVRQDVRRAETRYNNLIFPHTTQTQTQTQKKSVMSSNGLPVGGRDFHVERLAEPIERIVDKRTAGEIGVDKRYSCEGAFEAKQKHKEEANHEEDRRGCSRGIHTIDRRHLL